MRSAVLCGLLLVSGLVSTSQAQGLLWRLPETDGTWVRFEGTYSQLIRRPNSTQGDLSLQWRRNVTIKSVGQATGMFKGEEQACRWIELKVETGKTTEGVLDAGPGGVRIYKLLVPESAIRGTVNEPVGRGREIFASYIPFVRGYRKIGDEPEQELTGGVFQLYPTVSLLRHYRDLEGSGGEQPYTVPAGNVSGTPYRGSIVMETPTFRSSNSAEIVRSDELPFGVAKWTATTRTEEKGSTDPRSEFRETGSISEELQAVATGDGAESELLVN